MLKTLFIFILLTGCASKILMRDCKRLNGTYFECEKP